MGQMTTKTTAGTGIDVSGSSVAVDVSDFMTNGSNNRVVTATGTDGMNGEANLTFDGTDLLIAAGGAMTSTKLLTVSVSGGTTLTEATHGGRYLICAGNVTLPSTSDAGEHYTILNTTGGDITIARNGNNLNGAGSDVTVGTYNGATCIAIGSNNWIVLGV